MSREDSERQRSDGGVDKPYGHEERAVERAGQAETAAVAEYSPTGWRRNVFPIVASKATSRSVQRGCGFQGGKLLRKRQHMDISIEQAQIQLSRLEGRVSENPGEYILVNRKKTWTGLSGKSHRQATFEEVTRTRY